MKKLLLALTLSICIVSVAFADRIDAAVTATTALVQVLEITGTAHNNSQGLFQATLNIGGTFNGCTIHWLTSTDGGTTKGAMKDLTGTAVTSTAFDNFGFSLGWPSGNAGTIMFASASGCTSAPSLAIDIDTNNSR